MGATRLLLLAVLLLQLCSWVFAQAPPSDWGPKIKAGNMIYTPSDQDVPNALMPVVANGYIGTVIGSGVIYIGGVFNGENSQTPPQGPSHRAVIPSTISITVTNAKVYAAAIDLEYAIYYRRSTLASNSNVLIEQRWYANRGIQNLLVHELQVDTTGVSSPVELSLSVNTTQSTDINFEVISTMMNNTATITNGTILIPEIPGGPQVQVVLFTTNVPSTITVPAGQNTLYRFLTVASTSLDSTDPLSTVTYIYETMYNFPELNQSHIAYWQKLWSSGIEIEGDLYLATAVNNSLYEILSNIRNGWIYSLSPGGISTDGYLGHTFWDSETWIYPTLLLLYPELAQQLLQYRYNRLGTAALNALSMGYQGVKFPWESAFSGIECTMYPPNVEGHLEVHINGDIARAVIQYWSVTQNLFWLNSTGYPIISGIAAYWASRVQKDPTTGQYVINDVQCPDENAKNVNNSIYTNVVASISLYYAYYFGELLGFTPPTIWLDIADNIKIPFNAQLQWHPEYDGYNGTQINQADVVLLQYPLGYPMSRQVAVNDLLYYQNHTDRNGMFTGDCSYSISWLRLGEPGNAEYYFNNTLLHLKPPFMVFTERIVGGIPHFITGAGGFLQNIIFGYMGLQLESGNITIYPSILPYGTTTQVTLRKFSYLNNLLTISFNATHITFMHDGPNNDILVLNHPNAPHHEKPQKHAKFSNDKSVNSALLGGPPPIFVIDESGALTPLNETLVFPIGKFTVWGNVTLTL